MRDWRKMVAAGVTALAVSAGVSVVMADGASAHATCGSHSHNFGLFRDTYVFQYKRDVIIGRSYMCYSKWYRQWVGDAKTYKGVTTSGIYYY